jgi:hypothetical protein
VRKGGKDEKKEQKKKGGRGISGSERGLGEVPTV